MKGVALIKGPKNPKIGEDSFYEVVEFHKGTVVPNPNTIKWKVFKKTFGRRVEAKGNCKTGMRVSFNFSPRSYGKEILVEAYLFEPEMKAPPGLIVKPVLGARKIVNTEILDANGDKITETPKYGQSITLKVTTQNMPGEILTLSLWERDTLKDTGHDASSNTKLWSGQSKTIDLKGIVEQKIQLTLDMQKEANKGVFDGSEHEYYLLVEATGMKTISATTAVSNTVVKPATPIVKQAPVKIKNDVGFDKIKVDDTNKVVKVVDTKKTEGILTAYFAKEEYTIKTDEKVGTQYYRFKNDNKDIDKQRIAAIIKKNVDTQIIAAKKYVKLDDIKNALTQKSYKKDDPISFNLYKLGANYIRLNSAPLEEEVFVVANTYLLDGKEVIIKIKEKEAVLVGANADVMVLEAKENGAEITTLKAKVEKGIAKVKIKLRPKSDEDLKTWKEKLVSGIKDGTHKYTVKNTFTVSGDLDKIATNIEKKSNEALASKHTVKKADISALLKENASYPAGTLLEFPKYKKAEENLWLKAECQGDIKKHEGEYLEKEGEYFVVGKKCVCEARVRAFLRMLRVGEGTVGEKGYTTLYGKKQFTGMSDHPREVICLGSFCSSAAGAYQILENTYNELKTYRTKYNISNFNQESQDKLCVVILKYNYQADRPNSFYNPTYWIDKEKKIRDLEKEKKDIERRKRFKNQNGDIIKMLIENNYDKAVLLSSLCWASLPDAPYGQPSETNEECKTNYQKFLKEELEGKTDIHLKKGFLQEFGYNCSCNKESVKKNSNVNIHFEGQTANHEVVSQLSMDILQEVGEDTNNFDIYITSTARTPYDQARIMFHNCQANLQEQRNTYLPPGQKIIDVYVENKNKAMNTVISLMEAKIISIGPSTVSLHCADYTRLNVFDISIIRLSNPSDFLANIQSRVEVSRVLIENGVYHVEIPQ